MEPRRMTLKKKIIEELKRIIEKDYGVLLSDEKAQEIGLSYLKLIRIALKVEIRKDNLRVTRNIRTNKKKKVDFLK